MSNIPSANKPATDSAVDAVAAELRSRAADYSDPRIVELVIEYEEALRSGQQPRRSEFTNRYPELAHAVAACLDGVDLVYADRPSVEPRVPRVDQPVTDERQERIDTGAAPLGDFRIVRELARGGMGVVYEAEQLSLGRRVALKVLPFAATIDERQLQRFKLEAQAAALLHHNHIVPVYAVGCERGVHYYAMQLIEGQSLAVVIRQLREQSKKRDANVSKADHASDGDAQPETESLIRGRAKEEPKPTAEISDSQQAQAARKVPSQTDADDDEGADLAQSTLEISQAVTAGFAVTSDRFVRRAVTMIIQASQALEHAHQAGVVHRDIKPANLLVDKTGRVWVTDFGLAQIQADINLTRSGDMLGTLRYMSPEQAGGNKATLDHRTDVYSLGATLYELLTLAPVFAGETQQELLYQILNDEPRGLREKNRAISTELETVVLKSLSKNPAERYASADAFAADLQRFLDHQPIVARRPTMIDRARKWSRRHPSVAIATGVLLVVIAVALSISNRLISDEQEKTNAALLAERQRANEAEQSFQQARDAVDALFQISEEELAGAGPDQDIARRRVLEVVLSHYQEFIEQRKDDPESQADLEHDQQTVERILHELTVIQQSMRLRLLDSPIVRQELKLTPEQEAPISELNAERRKRERAQWPGSPDAADDEQLRNQMIEAAQVDEQQVREILTAEQEARFQQLAIQAMGLAAFKEPEIVDALELAPDQRREIRAIERSFFWGRGGRGRGGRGRRNGDFGNRGSRDQMSPSDQFGRQANGVARALTVLTEAQRNKWQELIGEPLPGIEEMGQRRGRRGPRRDGPEEE